MEVNNLNEARALIKQARLDKKHLGATSPFPKAVKEALMAYALDESCPHGIHKIAEYCGLKNVLPKWIANRKPEHSRTGSVVKSCSLLDKLNNEKALLVEKLNLIKQCEALNLKVVIT